MLKLCPSDQVTPVILRLESAIGRVPGIHAVDCYRAGTVGGTEDSEQSLPRGNLGQLIQRIGQGTGNVEIVLEPGPIAGLVRQPPILRVR
jgi:hypothetical protein